MCKKKGEITMKLNVWVTKKEYKGKTAWSLSSWHDDCNFVYVRDTVEEAIEAYKADHQHETLEFNFIYKF